MQTPDETLMAAIAQGDPRAYDELTARHMGRAYRVAQRLLSPAEAEEAVQDAFLKLWLRAQLFDAAKAKFTTWFYRIVTNACFDIYRRREQAMDEITDDVPDSSQGVEAALDLTRQQARIRRAIHALPQRQQTALVLCYYEGFSNQQAAEIMGVHIKALEALLVRARKTLRYSLADMKDERA